MPEHRAGTPAAYRELESFLWHDFAGGLDDWAAWLRHRGARALDPASSVAAAMRLHAALRTLEAGHGDREDSQHDAAAARRVLNDLVAEVDIRPQIDLAGHVHLVASDASAPVAVLLHETLEAMSAGAWRRFKLCREPSCRASYYDVSKAAAKLWCEMTTCGSRNKMRRYRARA